MGFNSVAVLLNDHMLQIAESGALGKRMADAVRDYSSVRGRHNFGSGMIISQDHADGYQVTVVHGNFGWRVSDADYDKYFDGIYAWQAFNQMKECLERNGYKVTKRRNPKASSP